MTEQGINFKQYLLSELGLNLDNKKDHVQFYLYIYTFLALTWPFYYGYYIKQERKRAKETKDFKKDAERKIRIYYQRCFSVLVLMTLTVWFKIWLIAPDEYMT